MTAPAPGQATFGFPGECRNTRCEGRNLGFGMTSALRRLGRLSWMWALRIGTCELRVKAPTSQADR